MDQLRGLPMLLVVTFHAATVGARFADMPPWLAKAVAIPNAFFMALMMFISGMMLAGSLRKTASRFFEGKARGVIWPYLLWSVIFLALAAPAARDYRFDTAFLTRVIWVPPTYLWFLWFLMAYYIIVWVLDRLRVPVWMTILGAFVLSFGPDTYRFSRFFFLLAFFAGGYWYVLRRPSLPAGHQQTVATVTSVAVLVAAGVLVVDGVAVAYEPQFVLVPVAAVLLGLMWMPSLPSDGVIGRALAFVGRESIVFYALHFPVIWLTAWALGSAGVTSGVLAWTAGVVLGVGVSSGVALLRLRLHMVDWLFTLPPVLRDRPDVRAARLG